MGTASQHVNISVFVACFGFTSRWVYVVPLNRRNRMESAMTFTSREFLEGSADTIGWVKDEYGQLSSANKFNIVFLPEFLIFAVHIEESNRSLGHFETDLFPLYVGIYPATISKPKIKNGIVESSAKLFFLSVIIVRTTFW